jgi:hypothetical protein
MADAPSFSSRFRADKDSGPAGRDSASDALDTLENLASTPQQHAAIKTLRRAFEETPPQTKKQPPMSPGQQATARAGESKPAGRFQ